MTEGPARPRPSAASRHLSDCPTSLQRVAITRGSPQGLLTIASALVDLPALADVCCGESEQDPPFGLLNCGFTVQSGASGAHDEAWIH